MRWGGEKIEGAVNSLLMWMVLFFPHQIQCINISLPFGILCGTQEEDLVMLSKSNLPCDCWGETLPPMLCLLF